MLCFFRCRYPGAPVRFMQSVRQRAGGVLTFQVPADSVRQPGVSTVYQGIRNTTFKTQPLIVSTVSAAPSGSVLTSTTNMSQGNTFLATTEQGKEIRMQTFQQLTPDQQRLFIQRHQLAQRPALAQQNLDANALAQRQKKILQQKQALITQMTLIQQQLNNANISPNTRQQLLQQKNALIFQSKELSTLQQAEQKQLMIVAHRQQMLMQQQKNQQQQQTQQKQDVQGDQTQMQNQGQLVQQHILQVQQPQNQMQQNQMQQQKQVMAQNALNQQLNQVLVTTSAVQMQQKLPPRSPVNQQLNQLLSGSPQQQFNQSINSPLQPPSPQQFSQQPHSPMIMNQQPVQSPIMHQNSNFSRQTSSSPAPPQSPRVQHSYGMHSASSSVSSHYSQPPSSPMPSQSPRHVSQFVHPSSSPVPPQSPIFTSQAQYVSHTSSPIPSRSPVLVRRPSSVESQVQQDGQNDIHSQMGFGQESYNQRNENDGGSTGGSAGGGMNFVNSIPIPEEFKKLGIKPGLLGGSPKWLGNEKKSKSTICRILPQDFHKFGIKGGLPGGSPTWNENAEGESNEKSENIKCSTSADSNVIQQSNISKSSTSSQFCSMEDAGSRDSTLFTSFPGNICLKVKSPSSLSDFEGNEYQSCTTPKHSEDDMELPIVKDVPLSEGCKILENNSENSLELPMYKESEENSLGMGDFPSTMEDNEMSIPLDIDSTGLHLALDSADVRGDDLLNDCLGNADLLGLNVNDDQDVTEDVKFSTTDTIPSIPFRTTSVVQTTTTACESKEDGRSVIATHAFHSYAKVVKKENAEEGDELTPESASVVPDTSQSETTTSPNIKEEECDEKAQETKAITTSVVTRTTSVLQMTPSVLQGSSVKEAATHANVQPHTYSNNFHSYVKKLLKPENSSAIEESNFEKDKILFDQTLMRVKTEKMSAEAQENATVGSTANSVIAKSTKIISLTQSTNQSAKENQTSQAQHVFPVRMRLSDDSQNVLLKQLLQNSGNASVTHSTMTQHVAKSLPSPSYRSPPSTSTPESTVSVSSEMAVAQILDSGQKSDNVRSFLLYSYVNLYCEIFFEKILIIFFVIRWPFLLR